MRHSFPGFRRRFDLGTDYPLCGVGQVAGTIPPLSFVRNLGCGGSAIVVQHRPAARSSAIGAAQHGLGLDGGGCEEIPAMGTLPLDHAGWRLPRLSVDRPCVGWLVFHAVPF